MQITFEKRRTNFLFFFENDTVKVWRVEQRRDSSGDTPT